MRLRGGARGRGQTTQQEGKKPVFGGGKIEKKSEQINNRVIERERMIESENDSGR